MLFAGAGITGHVDEECGGGEIRHSRFSRGHDRQQGKFEASSRSSICEGVAQCCVGGSALWPMKCAFWWSIDARRECRRDRKNMVSSSPMSIQRKLLAYVSLRCKIPARTRPSDGLLPFLRDKQTQSWVCREEIEIDVSIKWTKCNHTAAECALETIQ